MVNNIVQILPRWRIIFNTQVRVLPQNLKLNHLLLGYNPPSTSEYLSTIYRLTLGDLVADKTDVKKTNYSILNRKFRIFPHLKLKHLKKAYLKNCIEKKRENFDCEIYWRPVDKVINYLGFRIGNLERLK